MAVGPGRLVGIKQEIELPLVAIGGINMNNIREVMAAGADAACVISAVLAAEDAEVAARDLAERIKESQP
jgi:thiamine-phosphate pyrophosphorylase